MKESQLQTKILKELNETPGCKAIKVHCDGFTEKGTPDIIGAFFGTFFAIEVKVNGNDCSRIQIERLDQWYKVGGYSTVAREGFDATEFLDAVIETRIKVCDETIRNGLKES